MCETHPGLCTLPVPVPSWSSHLLIIACRFLNFPPAVHTSLLSIVNSNMWPLHSAYLRDIFAALAMPESCIYLPSYGCSLSLARIEAQECLSSASSTLLPHTDYLTNAEISGLLRSPLPSLCSLLPNGLLSKLSLLAASPLLWPHREFKPTGHHCLFVPLERTYVFDLLLSPNLRTPSQGSWQSTCHTLCHLTAFLELIKFVKSYQPIRSPQNTAHSLLSPGQANPISAEVSLTLLLWLAASHPVKIISNLISSWDF